MLNDVTTLYLQLLFLTINAYSTTPPVRFDDFQVYRVTPLTTKQLTTLQQLEAHVNSTSFNFWTHATETGQPVDIMVPPHLKNNFQNVIEGLDSELWIENLQKLIDKEKTPSTMKSQIFNWDDYYSLEMLNTWLDSLSKNYPEIVTSIVGGQTYEGREIRGVKVCFGPGKKGAFLEGGIHAREWISPATVTYVLNELLNSSNPAVRTLAKARDWYIFPVVNPDGYVYSHTTNRLWRKTRNPYGLCYGADPNRNWNYHWKEGGTSEDPCDETYPGSSAFSEIETRTLSEYISSVADKLDAYIAFHSYSQLLLVPFGHQGHEKPENNDELLSIGKSAIEKLASRYGTHYRIGNTPEAIYVASGGSMDWVRGVFRHIRLVYTYELRDKGKNAFILPKEQIKPTGEETLDSLVAMFQEADGELLLN